MSEETNFWGVAVQGYGKGGYPASVLLPGWRLRLGFPGSKPVPFYPVFSSRESASAFVREHGVQLEEDLLKNLLEDIRLIQRSEVPPEHYVLSDRRGLVNRDSKDDKAEESPSSGNGDCKPSEPFGVVIFVGPYTNNTSKASPAFKPKKAKC